VEDTGIGIAPDKHEMIFSKFTQADLSTARKYGGTGLGLAITRHLVDIMDGQIKLESLPGNGTTFYVDIPVFPIAQATQDTNSNDGPVSSFKTDVSLLVVDDHPVNLLFMRKVLKKLGFNHVDEAASGREALDILLGGHRYDLILMDCQMPEIDGFEACKRIRAGEVPGNENTNIIAITADAMSGAKERCLASGMNDYISKPIDINKMTSVLSVWLPHDGVVSTGVVSVAEETADLSIIDWERLEMFSDGDEEEKKALVDIFVQYAEESLAILRDNTGDNGQDEWKKAAHKLKGSAANLGASLLAKRCEEAEYGYQQDENEKFTMLKNIENNFDDLKKALQFEPEIV